MAGVMCILPARTAHGRPNLWREPINQKTRCGDRAWLGQVSERTTATRRIDHALSARKATSKSKGEVTVQWAGSSVGIGRRYAGSVGSFEQRIEIALTYAIRNSFEHISGSGCCKYNNYIVIITTSEFRLVFQFTSSCSLFRRALA